MKIGIISDIHANFPALKAVITHLKAVPVDEILDLGDFLGFGAFPEEVAALLMREKIPGIIGNYDIKILKFPEMGPKWEKTKPRDKYDMWRFTWEELSQESITYALSLPEHRRMNRLGWEILSVHGSPESVEEHLGPLTPQPRMEELAELSGSDIVLCGHSHIPFIREAGGTTFINPGSVGLQEDGDARASCAVLTLTGRSMNVSHYRVDYDYKRSARQIRLKGLPDVYMRMTLEGRNYRCVMAENTAVKENADSSAYVSSALNLGRDHTFEEAHALQVTRLALMLFDCLKDVHGLGRHERLLLECAGILHDIGIIHGTKGHHKHSMDMILKHGVEGIPEDDLLAIALVGRYHRKALPSIKHDRFASLNRRQQEKVRALAAILRVADGLDRTHRNLVDDITCRIVSDSLVLICKTSGNAEEELLFGLEKSDLMEEVFGMRVEVRSLFNAG